VIIRYGLATARDRELVPATPANPVESVSVAFFSVGASSCLLHIGHGAEGYLITQEGQTWELDPPWEDGLFISTPGGGSGVLDIAVTFRTYREPQPVMDVTRARAPAQAGQAGHFVDQLLRNFGLKR
jgi:hypothetical protein